MPELRRDPVVGYWTIIATERSRRPVQFQPQIQDDNKKCPFCENHENETPKELYAVRKGGHANGPGWEVRVISSKKPILSPNIEMDRHGEGMYDLMQGVGAHEVLIETPEHGLSLSDLSQAQVEKVVQTYLQRMTELERDPRFKYVLLFKNHGLISGTPRDLVRHSRSQLIATPVTPKRVKEELLQTKTYYDRRERCVTCDVYRQESSDKSRLVMENEHFFAFCPFASRMPFEVWILPKKHSADFRKLPAENIPAFASILKSCLGKIKKLLNDPPYNFILHTAPFRHKAKEGYWKTIEEDYHWYFQISPRLSHEAGFEWGTGVHINPTPPEDAAQLLRETEI